MAVDSGAPDYEGGGLSRETNWWGAFVIGLAGTILVTGIAPVMVTSLGAAAIPVMVVITITGYLLCLLLAELSAMMPERTGGSPTYAYVAYKDKWPRFAKHVNGFTSWAYWLGWFPVAPLNMILASFYIVDKFGLSTNGFTPIHTPIAYWTIVISVVGILLVFIPAWLGIRLGAMFATVLGLLSMIPLTLLALMPFLHPSAANWGNLSGFHQLDGSSFFSADLGHNWLDDLHRLLVPPDLERDRDGGGRLLHRRVPRPGARRQDRDEPGGPVRPLHLHDDPGRVRGRAGRHQAERPDRRPIPRRSSRRSPRRCSGRGRAGSTGRSRSCS